MFLGLLLAGGQYCLQHHVVVVVFDDGRELVCSIVVVKP
jgi:hypothetical protein